MKILKNYLFLLIAMTFILASCNKENIDEEILEVEEPTIEVVETNPLLNSSLVVSDGLLMDCFTIHYAFDVEDQDGNISTITSEEDWNALMENEENFYVDFVYPITITYEDGETIIVEDHDALCDAFISCIPEGGWGEDIFPAYLINTDNSCYELVYPLTLVDENGEETAVNDEDEFAAAVVDTYQSFVYPFTLLHEDGEELVVNSTDELFNALFSCSGWEPTDPEDFDWETGFEYIGCFTVNFPLDVINGDGEVVTVADHMELCDLMFEGDFAGYAFPMTLIDVDGNITIVDDQTALDAALDDCPEIEGPDESHFILLDLWGAGEAYSNCFTVNYPITVLLENSETAVINNADELDSLMINQFPIGMELPLNVTMVSDGAEVEINTEQDYISLIEGC